MGASSPCALKITGNRQSSTARTGHHCWSVPAKTAPRRSRAPPYPPFPVTGKMGSKRRRASTFVEAAKRTRRGFQEKTNGGDGVGDD